MRFLIATTLVFTWMSAMDDNAVSAQQFRIETEVTFAEKFASQNLTLFSSGYVHDFMTTDPNADPAVAPEIIVIWDRQRQELAMMDVARELKTTLTHEEIIGFCAALKAREELQKKEPFLFNPEFETSFDEGSGWLTLESKPLTYEAKGEQPASRVALTAYQEFADWYARLNAVDPGKMPPFARLELNRQIKAHSFIPEQVKLRFKPSGYDEMIATSRHTLFWNLAQTDHARIEVANELKLKFREASLQEYNKLLISATAQ